jgi:hypothetical protein
MIYDRLVVWQLWVCSVDVDVDVDVDVELASSYCLFNLVSIAADESHSLASHSSGVNIYVTTIVRKNFPVRAGDPLTCSHLGIVF